MTRQQKIFLATFKKLKEQFNHFGLSKILLLIGMTICVIGEIYFLNIEENISFIFLMLYIILLAIYSNDSPGDYQSWGSQPWRITNSMYNSMPVFNAMIVKLVQDILADAQIPYSDQSLRYTPYKCTRPVAIVFSSSFYYIHIHLAHEYIFLRHPNHFQQTHGNSSGPRNVHHTIRVNEEILS